MKVFISLLFPFLGTTLGSLCVFFVIKNLKKSFEIIILSFAAGVMLAASIWSLIMPALKMSNVGVVSLGLLFGILLFYLIDSFLIEKNTKTDKMLLAINLHNIPEGMAIGVLAASYLHGSASFTMLLALSLGIAIQNFPEGFIVAIPSLKKTKNKKKAFINGIISAFYELMGALITLIFTNVISSVLPFLLSVAAAAMIYVVITELIPESSSSKKNNIIWFMIGFMIMMILDVVL